MTNHEDRIKCPVLLRWVNDLTECGKFMVKTARIRHGNTYKVDFQLYVRVGNKWKDVGIYDRKRDARQAAFFYTKDGGI